MPRAARDHALDDVARRRATERNHHLLKAWRSAQELVAALGRVDHQDLLARADAGLEEARAPGAVQPGEQREIEALVAANPFDDSTRFVGAEHTEIDQVQLIAWNLEFDQSSGSMVLEYPTLGFRQSWQTLVSQGYRQSQPEQRLEVTTASGEKWPCDEKGSGLAHPPH